MYSVLTYNFNIIDVYGIMMEHCRVCGFEPSVSDRQPTTSELDFNDMKIAIKSEKWHSNGTLRPIDPCLSFGIEYIYLVMKEFVAYKYNLLSKTLNCSLDGEFLSVSARMSGDK